MYRTRSGTAGVMFVVCSFVCEVLLECQRCWVNVRVRYDTEIATDRGIRCPKD